MARVLVADRAATMSETGQPSIMFNIMTIDPLIPGGADLVEVLLPLTGDETVTVLKSKLVTLVQDNLTRINTMFGLNLTVSANQMILPTYGKG